MRSTYFSRRGALTLGALPVLVIAFLIGSDRRVSDGKLSMEEASRLELPHIRSSFSPKNRGDDARGRYEYDLFRLRDPATGRIPVGIRTKELAFARSLPRAEEIAAKTGRLTAENWRFRGPSNVGGRTRALAVDLDYNGTSNRRILAGGISGGIYLSEDDGSSWTLTTSLADLASVTCLAQDPTNRNTWYFGTGELLGNSTGGGSGEFHGHGLFKSTDSGRSWVPLPSTRDGKLNDFDNLWDYVWNVTVHPSGVVLAATYGAIFRSADGGATWQFVLGRQQENEPFNAITDVAVAPDGDVYATLSRNGSGTNTYGVFRSADAGNQWQNVSPPGLATDPYRMVLGPAPSDPNTIYLLVQSNQEGATAKDHQLFRLNEAAGVWTDLSSALPDEQGVEGNASFSTQGGYDQIVRVKPDNAAIVFVGGTNLYRSIDGGASFTRIGGYSSPANFAQFDHHHSDQHSLAFLPTNANVAVSGHDGGLSRSRDILAQPHSWSSLNNGYVTTQFYAVAIDPLPGGESLIGGLQDNGSWGTQTLEAASDWFELLGGDGAYAAVTPGATAFYVSAQNGVVFRLRETGFAAITPAGAREFTFINPFVLDPNDARVMYMGEAGGVWRNGDLDAIPDGSQDPTAVNWTFLSASAKPGSRTSAIAVAKKPANRLYFATTDYQSRSVLVRVDNAHTNGPGVVITPPLSVQGFAPYLSSIAVNPDDGNELIAVFSNYNVQSIWHSTNAGGTWRNLDGNLGGENGPSVRTAAIVPTASGTMYVIGTSTGIYSTASLAGNETLWALEGGDVLGNVVVDMFAVRPEDGTIVAGSHGRGVFQATIGQGAGRAVATVDINEVQIDVQPGAVASATFTLTNTGTADLSYTIGAAGKMGNTPSEHRLQPDPHLRRPSGGARPFTGRSGGAQPLSAGVGHLAGRQASVSSGDFIVLDDGNDLPDDFLGWGDGQTPFQWGSRFTAPVGGFTLESLYVYMRSENASSLPVDIFISDPSGDNFVSGSLVLPPSSDGTWYHITLDPILLPEGQLFDVELVTTGDLFYPAGVDANGLIPESGFFWFNSGLTGWYAELADVPGYENGAWLIRAEGTAGGAVLNLPPTASITASKTQAVVNESIAFDGSGSRDPDGTIVQFAWDFGDGGSSAQASAQHAFAQPGVYTVSLTVTDDKGATGQASRQITIGSGNQPPVASIQPSSIQAVVNEEITFDGSGSHDPDGSITGYDWAFGDGGSSNEAIARHSYAEPGTFSVSLTVTDNEGEVGQASVRMTILAEPSRLTASPPSGRLGPGETHVITVTYDASNQTAGQYRGEVTLSTNGGSFTIPVAVNVGSTVDIDSEGIPERFSLEQNYPNPFNPRTTIQFQLERSSNVRLSVFDVNGRFVRRLVEGSRPSGTHQVAWDGEDASGRPVASGTYFYRLEEIGSGGGTATHFTRKMILLR